jgi:hypothetical protein
MADESPPIFDNTRLVSGRAFAKRVVVLSQNRNEVLPVRVFRVCEDSNLSETLPHSFKARIHLDARAIARPGAFQPGPRGGGLGGSLLGGHSL